MMKKISRPLSILLSLLLLLSVSSAVQAAQTPDAVGDMTYSGNTYGCQWELDTNTGVMLISTREGTNCMMDDYFSDNQPWAEYAEFIRAVRIEDGVKNVGEYAFFGMNTIKSVYIGKTVETVGYSAFKGCDLAKVTIPDSVEEINNYAFQNNPRMTSVTIPATVDDIGVKAFGYQNDQKTDGFTIQGETGSEAEKYAKNNDFTFVAEGENFGATGTCTWRFEPSAGVLTIDGSGAMADYVFDAEKDGTTAPWWDYTEDIKNIVIGDGVTRIGDYAFSVCLNAGLSLGSSVKSIGMYAFFSNNLNDLTLPDSVEAVDAFAFYGNVNLTELNLCSHLKTIGESAFSNCFLSELTIPDSVESIGDAAFYNNQMLSTLTLGNQLRSVGAQAFLRCGFDAVEIPESVTEIGDKAFGMKYNKFDDIYEKIEGFTIYGYSGTAAEIYANENGFAFVGLDEAVLYGDVNGDGSVTIDDATLVQKAVAELESLDANQQKAADVNGDGDVTIDDATLIQKYVAEIIDCFPAEPILG